jgi:peptide/nickel transport system substrate-binding protein
MNWSKIFFWIKKKQGTSAISMPSQHFDRKLVKKIQPRLVPKWPQLRYLGSFLSSLEKKVATIALVIFFLSSVSWGLFRFFKNTELLAASGGEYSEALIGEPKFINPLFSSTNDVDTDLTSLIYSSLFKYDDNQKLTPELASDYSVTDDGRTYNINLRQDIKWSDGDPLTADDVIYTFESIQNPEVSSPLLATFQDVTVERTGDYSVSFTLKEPFAPFLQSLTVGILPEHIWANIPPFNIRLANTNLQPVGSGPWKFSKLTKDSTGNIQNYTLERNDSYFQTLPYLKTVVFKFYSDISQAASALKSQDVKAVSFVPQDLASKIAGKNFKLYQFRLPQYTALFFNENTSQFLKNSESRLALNLALDKNKVVEQALNKNGEVINSPILKGELGYKPDIAFPGFDIEQANKILDKNWSRIQPEEFFKNAYDTLLKTRQAEIDDIKSNTTTPAEEIAVQVKDIDNATSDVVRKSMSPNQTFYRKNKANEILQLKLTTVDTPEYQLAAETIANMWRAVGVKIDIEIYNSNQVTRNVLKERTYEILLYGEIVGADPDPYPFWHSSQINYPGLNLSMFTNRTVDTLLEDARATTTGKIRTENYIKFQEILAKELPAVFLYTPTYNFIASKEIKGVAFENIFAPADRFTDLTHWYIKTKRHWK